MEKKPKKLADLISMVETAKSLDRDAVAEMRTNILMVAGEHYTKRMNETFARSRSANTSHDTNPKLRITKNNIYRAHKLYTSSISSLTPGVTVSPRNELELQDRKSAELNKSVWEYLKAKYKVKALFRDALSDFCGPGECVYVLKFDPKAGRRKGFAPLLDENGNPVVDELGQPMPDESSPVFAGEFLLERRYAHNMFRDPSTQQMKDSRWVGFDIVESKKELLERYENDPEKRKAIVDSSEDYVVFDANKAGYTSEKDQTVIHEIFVKPCHAYPDGYFYQFTKAGMLEQGPLPEGIWPVIWKGFDEHPTKVRATSPIKIARPFQAEINRASSQAALASVTIGEDKILYQAGSDLTQGSLLPGVRGLKYNGEAPTILPGRSGEQFFSYIDRQYVEMDRALLIDQIDLEKMNNLDPYALLFKSMSTQKKFAEYAEKFGEWMVEFVETLLALAKIYLDDDEMIAACGKAEFINIAEFRATEPLHYRIHVEEQDETIETKLGKQLVLNQILQYSSGQLERNDIGKLITQMPFGNWKYVFSDFTIDETNTQNDFLAIERGEIPKISPRDNSEYALAQVAKRKKERDYSLLHPFVQSLYDQYEQYHSQKLQQETMAAKAMQSEMIPTAGAMIACDMYVANEDPSKAPKRVRVPYQALDWLVNTLAQQGATLDKMEAMNQGQVLDLANQYAAVAAGGQPTMPQNGQASPMEMQV